MPRLVRVCLKCDHRVINTDEEFTACANVIGGFACGSMEWAVVPLPDQDLELTVNDRRFLKSLRIDPEV